MPLLNREPFVKARPPADIQKDDEVFYCKLTDEVFVDYDEFFERTILCNSLVWTCSLTGKPGLTYGEALESEERAQRTLESLPSALVTPILFLIRLTHRTRLGEVCDDVWLFAKDHFFKSELIEVEKNSVKNECTIREVIPPGKAKDGSNGKDDDSEDARAKTIAPDGADYSYIVADKRGHVFTAKGDCLSRRKFAFTKEKLKLLVKFHCEQDDSVWKVKYSSLDKYKLQFAKFENFYAGPWPKFPRSAPAKRGPKHVLVHAAGGGGGGGVSKRDAFLAEKNQKTKKKTPASKESSPRLPASKVTTTTTKPGADRASSKEGTPDATNGDDATLYKIGAAAATGAADQTTLYKINEAAKNNAALAKASASLKAEADKLREALKLKAEETKKQKDELKEKALQLRMDEKARMDKQREDIKKAAAEAKERLKLQREQERERAKEEKKKMEDYYKEWSKSREDMQCDDLRPLPHPRPVHLQLPQTLFGDLVAILEFFANFGELFNVEEEFPDGGLDLEFLQKALLCDSVEGPLTDLLKFLLKAVFNLVVEEEEEANDYGEDGAEWTPPTDKERATGLVDAASTAAQWTIKTQGIPLEQMALDPYTLSEALRRHILRSGAAVEGAVWKFRYQQRGGFSPLDDPGMEFKLENPHILQKLVTQPVFNLDPEERLRLLQLLVNQLTTFCSTRDWIEENVEKLKTTKNEARHLQWAEKRREAEEATLKTKEKNEDRLRERLERLRAQEQKLKNGASASVSGFATPNGLANPGGDVKKTLAEASQKLNNGAAAASGANDNNAEIVEMLRIEMENIKGKIGIDAETGEASPSAVVEAKRKKREEESAKAKATFVEKEAATLEAITKYQRGFSICPLGRDRFYRRYWTFVCLGGIFVEDNDETVTADMLVPIVQRKNSSPLAAIGESAKRIVAKATDATSTKIEDLKNEKDLDSAAAAAVNGVCNGLVSNGSGSDKENSPKNEKKNGPAPPDLIVLEGDEKTNGPSECITLDGSDDEENREPSPTPLLNGHVEEDSKASVGEDDSDSSAPERQKVRWAFFYKPEDVDQLIDCLNPRGFREGPLKQALLQEKSNILRYCARCPAAMLDGGGETIRPSSPSAPAAKHSSSSAAAAAKAAAAFSTADQFELNFRDGLLELEERLFQAQLGAIKVKDRTAWRDAIVNRNFDRRAAKGLTWSGKEDMTEEEMSELADGVIGDMAKATLQLRLAVEVKYLIPPLGAAEEKETKKAAAEKEKKKKRKKDEDEEDEDGGDEEEEEEEPTPSKTVAEAWEESLMRVKNFSQLYVHLSTLENSIAWQKSALNANCKICRRKGDPEKMLLCDACDRGHHMYCLRPQLKRIPAGEWLCPTCKPKKAENKKTPSRGIRKSSIEDEEEEEEDEEEEEEEEMEEEEEVEEEEDDEEECEEEDDDDDSSAECGHCWKPGKLVYCSRCPYGYHMDCAVPPLTEAPPDDWVCQHCRPEEKKKGGRGKKKTPDAGDKPPRGRQPTKGGQKRNAADASLNDDEEKTRKRRRACGECSPCRVKRNCDRCVFCKNRDTLKQKCELRRCRVLNPDHVVKTVGMLGIGVAKPKSTRRSAPPEPTEESDEGEEEDSPVAAPDSEKIRAVDASTPIGKADNLLKEICRHKDAWPFLKPVDPKKVPDYYQLIHNPMDFQTIRDKLSQTVDYKDHLTVVADIRLVFNNCFAYNHDDTPEFKAATKLSALFERKVKALQLDKTEAQLAEVAAAATSRKRSRRTN